MSILAQLEKAQAAPKKMFGVVAGPRLGGKTTLVGTLTGNTLMLQAAILESGCESAKALAKKSKNNLTVISFDSLKTLVDILKELEDDTKYDNIYIDGLSAITEMKHRDTAVQRMLIKNVWDGFRAIGEATNEVVLFAKGLTYADVAKKPKNVFVTCALDVKHDKDGEINEVQLSAKGNMAVSSITKLGESVVTVLPSVTTEDGDTGHRLVTKTQGFWPGRIDGTLAEDNPGMVVPANLQTVVNMVTKGVKP